MFNQIPLGAPFLQAGPSVRGTVWILVFMTGLGNLFCVHTSVLCEATQEAFVLIRNGAVLTLLWPAL